MVIICSIENEDKSNIATSLDQYRRQFLPHASVGEIQNYLKVQLVASKQKLVGDVTWEPAATVDMDRYDYICNQLSVKTISFFANK